MAWAPVLWAGFSMYLFIDNPAVTLPATIAWLALLSGVICFIGGLAGMVYLLAAAKTWRTVLLGLCAAVCNFGYMWWWYSDAIRHL